MTRTIHFKKYIEFEANVKTKGLKHFSYEREGRLFLLAIDGPLTFTHNLSRKDLQAYDSIKPYANLKFGEEVLSKPFAAKSVDGKKIYRRKHGLIKNCPTGNTSFEFVVPYNQVKINELEITNGKIGDAVDLIVHDTPKGHIQLSMGVPKGSEVPSALLNQFGFDVAVPDGFFRDQSSYDADLIKDMKIVVIYKNNGTEMNEKNGVNIVFHELK